MQSFSPQICAHQVQHQKFAPDAHVNYSVAKLERSDSKPRLLPSIYLPSSPTSTQNNPGATRRRSAELIICKGEHIQTIAKTVDLKISAENMFMAGEKGMRVEEHVTGGGDLNCTAGLG